MPPIEGGAELVSTRFVARASELGLSAPPVDVRLKIVRGTKGWSLFVQPIPPAKADGIAEWVRSFAPLRIEFGSRDVLRADFDRLPEAWRQGIGQSVLDVLTLDTKGQALVSITGPRGDLAKFTRAIRGPIAPIEIRHLAPAIEVLPLLTAPQDEALRYAVEAGYYLIPRPLNLRQLAKRLQISSASLSERLRRAEGRVLTRYVLEGGRTPWDAITLYDVDPLTLGGPTWPKALKVEVQG